MSEQASQKGQAEDKNIIFPDYLELWKEMYFKTEKALSESFNEYVSTATFSQMLNQTIEQQLSMEKINRQNSEKLLEYSIIPSKKDISRIAELVISVEEKVDALDYQLVDNVRRMADNMLSMVDTLQHNTTDTILTKSIDDKLVSLEKSIEDYKLEMLLLRKEMTSLSRKVDKLTKAAVPAKKSVSENQAISAEPK